MSPQATSPARMTRDAPQRRLRKSRRAAALVGHGGSPRKRRIWRGVPVSSFFSDRVHGTNRACGRSSLANVRGGSLCKSSEGFGRIRQLDGIESTCCMSAWPDGIFDGMLPGPLGILRLLLPYRDSIGHAWTKSLIILWSDVRAVPGPPSKSSVSRGTLAHPLMGLRWA